MTEGDTRRQWRLLPSEEILWRGVPERGVPRRLLLVVVPWVLASCSTVAVLFSALQHFASLPGASKTAFLSVYFFSLTAASLLLPRYVLDRCEYIVTDSRLLWRRGTLRRSMDRHGITFGRIRWNGRRTDVGDLELVRAVPFGPLMRQQRIVFHDIHAPDVVFAMIRGAASVDRAGDSQTGLTDRLDDGEQVVWGGGPEGHLLDWRNLVTAAIGFLLFTLGVRYGIRCGTIVLGLEKGGLSVGSWTWDFLVAAIGISSTVMLGSGSALIWHGTGCARALGRATEYLITDRRLLIRRGLVELSVDRVRIVDVAELQSTRGTTNLYLFLDSPHSRALADSGALRPWLTSRDQVPPVLYEVRDGAGVRELILGRPGTSGRPEAWMRDAA